MPIGHIRPAVAGIEEQQILAVSKLALGDPSVIAMWYGESDLPTDTAIRQVAIESLNAGETFYGHKRGLPEFQAALATYMSDLYGRAIAPDRVSLTQSGMSAIMMIFQTILDPGDNAVIVCPVWPNAQSVVRALAGEPRYAVLDNDEARGWHLDLEKVFAQCNERTRAIFVNTPNNPTGWTMPLDQMRELLNFARERGIWIVSDEVYARMVYDGRAAPSFLEIAEPDDPVLSVNSFSKSWAMTGWRIGWITHPPQIGELLGNMIEFNYSCVPTFLQRGGIHAIEQGEGAVAAMIDHCRTGRGICSQRLPNLPRVSGYREPEASFYGFFRIDGTEDRTLETCQRLVREAKVGIAPGTAFGPGAEGWYRLCFAQSPERLSTAFDRLESGLASL
ncbi:MAG: pyridoxal phosphate-dependent aminotransferase [Alphaproteobacteria bacterium]|nr:pyridoxal phosphate-dependent aminotransferase [Alphaproteobacteria bacterium]